jgi:peptidoglycan/LPS O-acetylase OafA/YrhL
VIQKPETTRAGLVAELVPPPPQTGTQFPILDSLRAVGALCVLTTHVAFWAGDYSGHGFWGTLLARLDVGVAIFFVLSGFLLSRNWLIRAAEGRPAPSTGSYLWKRSLRIVPVYLIAVVLALTLIDDNSGLGLPSWIETLLMVNTFTGSSFPAGLTQMWSLAVEVTFYLVLPLLMLALVGRQQRLQTNRILIGLAVLSGVTVWWHLDGAARLGTGSSGATLQWLPSYLIWFALGILLALAQVLNERGSTSLARPFIALARQPGSCWTVVAGLMLVAATPLAGPTMLAAATPSESLTKNLIYAAIGFLIVLTGVFSDPLSRYAAVLGSSWCRRLGWISYGVFCLHLPILHLVMWTTQWRLFAGHGIAMWVLTLSASLVASEFLYRVVERPALRLKSLVHDRSSKTSAASTPTSGTNIR